jgi:hypothetical protein
LLTLFRILGAVGTVLLGAALVVAPIYAFGDRMTTVSALGIAGIAFLLAAWAVRKVMRITGRSGNPPPDEQR